jgi:peptide deformylase
MRIVHFPHPVLRHKAKPLRRVDDELRGMVREMFDLMYATKGIGLAATQVALPYRLFVINLESDADHPEEEHVFINPVITARHGSAEAEEGCLSLPGLNAPVRRAEKIRINAFDLGGNELSLDLDGLFARACQHEVDHLDGVLFIDRLSPTVQADVRDKVEEFRIEFEQRRSLGEIPSDAEVAKQIAALEKLRT